MTNDRFVHPSDQHLLLALDGELSGREAQQVEEHLTACWSCRTRKQKLESTIADFVCSHQRSFVEQIPPVDGPRALLRARLEQVAMAQPSSWRSWITTRSSWRVYATAAAALAFITILLPSFTHPGVVRAVTMPDPILTPGATVAMQPAEICAVENVKNRDVPEELQLKVFEKYGIKGAPTQAYEVDYLITPALGGAEDLHNLWPQSYESTVWNAFVKDQLEDYLRYEVCAGQMDLATAQHEIAGDWIAAYKKHFHTDQPLKEIPDEASH